MSVSRWRVIFRGRFAVAMIVLGNWGAVSQAATIHVGDHQLIPNVAGQQIEIFVTGGEAVSGVNLFVQVGDGGPELGDFGVAPGTDGPAITAVDLKTDTIFALVPNDQDDLPGLPQVAISSIEFGSPGQTTLAEGKLVTLTLDTRGFQSGSWELRLTNVLFELPNGPFETDFAGVGIDIVNGSINIGSGAIGDLNHDGRVDSLDIDLLASQIRAATVDLQYDLDGSSAVNSEDVRYLVEEILETKFGDANLDGQVDAEDLGAWDANRFTDATLWARGDFSGDGKTDVTDFNLWYSHRAAASSLTAVPEPRGIAACFAAMAMLVLVRVLHF